jgi:hypothetical protein
MRCPGLTAVLCGLLLASARASLAAPGPQRAAPSPYDDERLTKWSAWLRDGARDELLRSVEADLRSRAPHPLAASVWTATQLSLGLTGTTMDAAATRDPSLRAALGSTPRILDLTQHNRFERALAEFPPERSAELRDAVALTSLANAAWNLERKEDTYIYARAALRLWPGDMEAAWLIVYSASDQIVLGRLRADLGEKGALASAPVARLIAGELDDPPTTDDQDSTIDALDRWLRSHPRDAGALDWKGMVEYHLGRSGEAIQAFDATYAINPFRPDLTSFVPIAARLALHKVKEAHELADRLARLSRADPAAAEPRAAAWYGAAVLERRELGYEADRVQAARKKWPRDGELNAHWAALELAYERPAAALPFAELANKEDPEDGERRSLLMRALNALDRPEAVLKTFQSLGERTPEQYWWAAEALERLGKQQDRLELIERGEREFPGSMSLHRGHVGALSRLGRAGPALTLLREGFDREAPDEWAVTTLNDLSRTAGADPSADFERLIARYPWA